MAEQNGRRRLSLPKRIYLHIRMLRNCHRVTARGLRHPVAPGDSINLSVVLRVHIDGEFHV